jgi:hypothetical protein
MNSRPPFLLYWLTVIVIIGVIAPAAASWTDTTVVDTVIATGNIDPVFTQAEEMPRADGWDQLLNRDCHVSTSIENDGKRLVINIDRAYPGFSTTIGYEICNQGSVPVVFSTQLEADDELCVTNSLTEGRLDGNNDSAQGELEIQVGEVEESNIYDFELVLDFEQWNHS